MRGTSSLALPRRREPTTSRSTPSRCTTWTRSSRSGTSRTTATPSRADSGIANPSPDTCARRLRRPRFRSNRSRSPSPPGADRRVSVRGTAQCAAQAAAHCSACKFRSPASRHAPKSATVRGYVPDAPRNREHTGDHEHEQPEVENRPSSSGAVRATSMPWAAAIEPVEWTSIAIHNASATGMIRARACDRTR